MGIILPPATQRLSGELPHIPLLRPTRGTPHRNLVHLKPQVRRFSLFVKMCWEAVTVGFMYNDHNNDLWHTGLCTIFLACCHQCWKSQGCLISYTKTLEQLKPCRLYIAMPFHPQTNTPGFTFKIIIVGEPRIEPTLDQSRPPQDQTRPSTSAQQPNTP